MRFAVPVSGSMVAAHFGHCEQFAFFDVNEVAKTILGKEIVPSPGHQPGFLPEWLSEQGVSVVIGGGMGSRAQDLFREKGIEVVTNILETDPEQAVLDYLRGRLKIGGNICDH